MDMRSLENRFSLWVIDHPWLIVTCSLLFFFSCAYGLIFIKIDSDLRIFFSKDNSRLLELEALENTYTKHENIIFVIMPKDGNVFTSPTLQAIKEITSASWQIPFSSRVDSITNYQHTSSQGDELVVDDFIADASSLNLETLQKRKSVALNDPMLVHRVLGEAGDITSINVNVIFDQKRPQDVSAVADYARTMEHDFKQRYPFLEIYVTGSVMFDTAFSEVGQRDMSRLAPLMFVVLILIIGISMRSWMAAVFTSVVILLTTLTAMGLAGWTGISINPATANAPTIILTLAVADSVHILIMFYRRLAAGDQKIDALLETLRVNLQAVFLTSLTTAIGFLTMNFSDAPPFQGLGNIVAMGVMAAFFYSIFLLPAMLMLIPVKSRLKPVFNDEKSFDKLVLFITSRPTTISVVLITTAAILGGVAFQNRLNDNWIRYFSDELPVRVATELMENKLTGSDYIEYSVPARGPDGIHEPEYLQNLDAFVQWLRKQPDVKGVVAITDVMKKLNRNMHGDDPRWYKIPESRALSAQYLLLYEMSLPLGLDLNNQLNVDKSSTRVMVLVENRGTAGLREIDVRTQQWLRENVPEYMVTRGSGLSIVWASISEQNIRSMLIAAFGALLAISVIFLLALRRVDMGLISMVPNMVPAMCAFGIWALVIGEIGLGLSVVVSMTLGIVVDDTVHFISKYIRARNRGKLGPTEAIKHTFHVAGSAMWVTTVALVFGFMVLMFSDYKMSADMGLLSAVTIAIALFMDFLLLPALLIRFDRR